MLFDWLIEVVTQSWSWRWCFLALVHIIFVATYSWYFVTAKTALYHCTIASYYCIFCVSLRVYFKRGVQPKCGVQNEKCGVQNSIFTSRNQLFWSLTHLIQYNLHSSSFQTLSIVSTVSARNLVSWFSGRSLKLLPPDVRF